MITNSHIENMLAHWLNTKPNGYFGSSYGADIESLFLRSLHSSDAVDKFLNKMKVDLPILKQLNSQQLLIEVSNSGFEKKLIVLKVGLIRIDLTNAYENRKSKEIKGETYDTNAK